MLVCNSIFMEKLVLKNFKPGRAAKELARIVETVTCLECCKLYILPETAICGHTLCHGCWIGRQTCPYCALPLKRRALKANPVIQQYTVCVQKATKLFEKQFEVKMEEFAPELTVHTINKVVGRDANKNVNAWLCDSQNHFSAPISTQLSTQVESPAVEVKTCEIQVHTGSKKPPSPTKTIHAPPPPQDDWDKIETIPDTEEISKNKENLGPMDIEPFLLDDEEYTTDHPRRSSRKRELKNESKPSETSAEKHSSSNISMDTDKLSRVKQNWSNVKKMRKEFSKLHKKNKNKLNVSIEMCKKTKSAISKSATSVETKSQKVITIEDLTPDIKKISSEKEKSPVPDQIAIDTNEKHNTEDNTNKSPKNTSPRDLDSCQVVNTNQDNKEKSNVIFHKVISSSILSNFEDVTNNNKGILSNLTDEKSMARSNIPFLKKSALQIDSTGNQNTSQVVDKVQQNEMVQHNTVQTVNHVVNDNIETDSDDIQITIKVGSTLTNIFIKKKKNDIKVKLNTDQAAQTSQCMEKSTSCNASPSMTKNCDVQNIEINIGGDGVVCTLPQQTKSVEASENSNKIILEKTISTKKNTASAETVPVEITASLEKELSKIMECDSKNSETQKVKSQKTTEKPHRDDKIAAAAVTDKELNTEDIELDEDLFASGSVKESNVQLLKTTKPAPSEILLPTFKNHKKPTQTQRQANKRNRENNDDVTSNKKPKVTREIYESSNEDIANEDNKDESSVNYDSVMGQVFASIDAEMANIDKSQSIIEDNNEDKTLTRQQACASAISQHSQFLKTQKTQRKVLGLSKLANVTQNLKSNLQQKDSESLFALSNIESQAVIEKGRNQKHGPETQANLDSLLTPGMCRDLAGSPPGEAAQATGHDAQADGPRAIGHDSQADGPQTIGHETQADGPQAIGNDSRAIDHDSLAIGHDSQADSPQATGHDSQTDGAKATGLNTQGDGPVQATPQDRDDSDMSVCEETPQKPSSFTKRSNVGTNSGLRHQQQNTNTQQSQLDPREAQLIMEIINISDTDHTKTDVTVVTKPKLTLETPTINQFCNSVQHNSTPVARKSLNFEQPMSRSIPQELFPKPRTPQAVPRYCVAASCLTSAEVKAVERLCAKKNWKFVKEYTKELTHLVVGVDEDGRSQRTVKFMCALAAGKWIVRYEWAETWMKRGAAQEEGFEALDWTGDPGPQRARTAARPLFQGLTFYCQPPFSVLSEPVLKMMLESAGGRVVGEARAVRVAGDDVRLLLAEPEHTQENQFTYLALELQIVPVNYEWALNCLGSYTLTSILDLMLCPSSLLPAPAQRWPAVFVTPDDESE